MLFGCMSANGSMETFGKAWEVVTEALAQLARRTSTARLQMMSFSRGFRRASAAVVANGAASHRRA